MILNRSLVNIYKNENRRNIGMYALAMLVYMFICIIPFFMSIINYADSHFIWIGEDLKMGMERASEIGKIAVSHQVFYSKLIEILNSAIGFSYTQFILTFCFAVSLANYSFGFLHAREQVDFFHSFPIKRNEIYYIKYLLGSSIYIITYIITNIIIGISAVINGVLVADVFRIVVVGLVFNIIYFLICYTISVFAMLLTGKKIIGFLGSLILIFLGLIAGSIICAYYGMFFDTYQELSFNDNILYFELYKLSPIYDFLNIMLAYTKINIANNYKFIVDNLSAIVISIIVIVVFNLLNIFVYSKRKLETSTNAMSNEIAKHIVRDVLVILASLCGIYISVIGFNGRVADKGIVIAVFGIILFGIISHAIIEVIYNQDFKMLFCDKWHMLFSIVVALLIFAIFKWDLFGYDRYIPNDNDVANVMFKIDGENNYNLYVVDEKTKKIENIHNQIEDMFHHTNLTDKKSIEAVHKLSQVGIETVKKLKKNNKPAATVEGGLSSIERPVWEYANSVIVVWVLKNREIKNRKYYIEMKKNVDTFETIYSNVEYKKSFMPFLRDEEKYEKVTINNFDNPITFKENEMKELLLLLKKDIINAKVVDKLDKEPTTLLNCYMDYASSNRNRLDTIADEYSYKNGTMEYKEERIVSFPIYDSFTNVLDFLKNKNVKLSPKELFNGEEAVTLYYQGKPNENVTSIEKKLNIYENSTFSDYVGQNNVFGPTTYKEDRPFYVEVKKGRNVINLTLLNDV